MHDSLSAAGSRVGPLVTAVLLSALLGPAFPLTHEGQGECNPKDTAWLRADTAITRRADALHPLSAPSAIWGHIRNCGCKFMWPQTLVRELAPARSPWRVGGVETMQVRFLNPEAASLRSSERAARPQSQPEVQPQDDDLDLGLQRQRHRRAVCDGSPREGASGSEGRRGLGCSTVAVDMAVTRSETTRPQAQTRNTHICFGTQEDTVRGMGACVQDSS